MTFRQRLTLFFVLIVVVPMIAVAILLVQVSHDSQAGKADARLAASLGTALALYDDELDTARGTARSLASDPATIRALDGGGASAADAAARAAVRRSDLAAVVLLDARGRELARSGAADAAAFASVDVRQGSRRLGTLLASGITAESYLREVHRLTGQEGVLVRGGQPVGATGALAETDIPLSGDVTVAGRELRARTASISGPTDAGGSLTLTLLGPRESAGAVGSEPLVAGVLLAFFALALVLVLPLLRDLGRLHERVAGQAVTDELTGLSNQRRFRELMRKEVGRANRFDRPLSLLMIDIDDFKGVNDTHGHLQGDRVLEAVAGVLRAESRDVDEPARYGGEEFALALPETPVEGAMLLAERIRARVEALRVPLGRQGELAVTVSVGVAGTPGGPPGDSDGLIAAADQALYAAKRAGKNRAEADAHSAPSTI